MQKLICKLLKTSEKYVFSPKVVEKCVVVTFQIEMKITPPKLKGCINK